MKTTANLALILHKLCNQTSESRNRGKSKKLLLITTIAIMSLLTAKNSMAATPDKTYATYTNNAYYSDTHMNPNSPQTSMDFGFLTQRLAVRYCQVMDLTMSFLVPGTTDTYVKLFTFSFNDYFITKDNKTYKPGSLYEDFTIGKFSTMGSISTTGHLINTPDVRNVLWGTWDFPPALMGKTITLKVTGNWIWDYNNIKSGFTPDVATYNANAFEFKTTVGPQTGYPLFSGFNPSTILSFEPQPNGQDKFSWKNPSYVSKFILYSNSDYTNIIDSVDILPLSKVDGSISKAISGAKFNVKRNYYIKQIYDAVGQASSSNFLRYEKKLGLYSHDGYKYPASVTATPKLNDTPIKVDLAITEGNTSSTIPSKYYIKRKVTKDKDETYLYLGEYTGTNYSDATVSSWTDYTYVVYTVPDAWTDKTIVLPELSDTIFTNTKPKPISFDNFKLKGVKGSPPYIKIEWDNTQWYSANNTIKLSRWNSSTKDWDDLHVENSATYFNDDKGLVENTFYKYKLEVNQWGNLPKPTKIDSTIVIDQVAITKIAASKNTYGDRINLQWEIDRLNLCDRFEIWRQFSTGTDKSTGTDNWSDSIRVNQFTAQSIINSWDDRDAAPGMLYRYKVVAIKSTKDLGDISTSATDIGFRMPVGVVTGRITYGTGTAVKGTSLYVSSSGTDGDMLYKSLKFGGDAKQGGKVNLTKTKHGCIADKGFTFQAWLKPLERNSTVAGTIFEVGSEYSIRMINDYILVMMGHSLQQVCSYKLESTIAVNSYFHLAVAYSLDKKLKIFINGVAKDSVTLTNNTYTCSFNETTTKSSLANNTVDIVANRLPFKGNIDDVRLWNRGITNTEAADNFNRYLGGSETGLIGYWPMDEGIGNYAFDCSKTDKVFNECHITDIKIGISETVVPLKEQLAIKGVTDADGNYIIRNIPFTGEGSTYSIQPVLGTHTFEPQQQLRYISPSSLVHNGTDFTDKSSFKIQGTIFYENTNYPVAGVKFLTDGIICMRDNKPIVSGSDGTYSIDVPIGEHKITLGLNGHNFIDKIMGQPLSIGLPYNFNVNKTNVDFTDTTKVTLVGRLVGGQVQAAKPIGFNRSIANIGKGIVQLTATNTNCKLNMGTAAQTIKSKNSKIASTAVIGIEANMIKITTDSMNGEFSVQVPPIPMKVTLVSAAGIPEGETFKTENISNFEINPLVTISDTIHSGLKIEGKDTSIIVDSYTYNQRLNLTYQAPKPKFVIKDKNCNYNEAFGDTIFNYVNLDDATKNKSYPLMKTVAGKTKYLKGNPIFTTGNIYSFDLRAYDEYDNGKGIKNQVPLSNANFYIENKISTTPEKTQYKLDSLGTCNYLFMAGEPNLEFPYYSEMTAYIDDIEWKVGTGDALSGIKGIILGKRGIGGTDFVTRGPDNVVVVLRDPPGSNSFATLQKGSTFSNTRSYSGTTTFSNESSATTKLGFELTTSLGFLGCSTDIKVKSSNDIGLGINSKKDWATSNSSTDSYTLSETISTSSSPDFVGAMADVFIAESSNIAFTKCKDLSFIPKLDTLDFKLGTSTKQKELGKTSFRYTQNHIVTNLIPAFKEFRNSLLKPGSISAVYTKTAKSQYYTELEPSNPLYGTKGTYVWVKPATIVNQVIDSVVFYRNQIDLWEQVIRNNEMEKLKASGKLPGTIKYNKQNLSFDAGTTLSNSITRTSSSDNSTTYTWEIAGVESLDGDQEVNGFGFSLKSETIAGGGASDATVDTEQHNISYGYTLKDGDAGNYFTVDVYTPQSQTSDNSITNVESEGGPIFITRAGVSSCPYEKADTTLFYVNEAEKSVSLNTSTVQLEKPGINIVNPTVLGIASGKQASYDLELKNLSGPNSSTWFQLSVDPASNPLGAIISIDGTPLTEPRLFLVPGTSMMKTVKLSQSSADDLEFNDIRLILASPCQSDIMADAKITAKFVPSCSDLTMVIDNRVVNTDTVTGKNDTTVLITLKDFNTNYKNFAGIRLQYKGVNESSWNLAKAFVYDPKKMSPDKAQIIAKGDNSITYKFSMKNDIDQTYQFRAKTVCIGTNLANEAYNETPIITVVKDMKTPQSMGVPSPSNGILTPETEVSVTFNEKIQGESIQSDDVQVWSVLNNAKMTDNVGLQFNGSQKAYTELPINLESSFTIEAKYIVNAGNTNGTLFSLGEGKNNVSLQLVGNNLKVTAGSFIKQTTTLLEDNSQQYFALAYNAVTKKLDLNQWSIVNGAHKLFSELLPDGLLPVGRVSIGENFKGKLSQFSIWNKARTFETISAEKSNTKTGKELNLVGYWPMDEGYGLLAADKARGRNLTVNSSWFIIPQGKSIELAASKHVVIKSSHIPILETKDFSIEFWFSGTSGQKNATLFSCGKENIDQSKNMTVAFDGDGNLNFTNNGIINPIPAGDVLNNNWHHFALSVMRGGNAIVFIDGAQKYQTSASAIGGMVGDSITVGARRYNINGQSNSAYDNAFTGSMDELRIWDCALTGENIRLDMHNSLYGTETGLIAYYPFEKSIGGNDMISSLDDYSIPASVNKKNGGIAIGKNVTFSTNTPAIKQARARVKVQSTITSSDNKVLINVTEDASLIENCNLEFEMKRILDLNGNRISSSLKWSAFVNMNRLKWQTESINLTKEVLMPQTFEATISNSSGKYENYVINGLPGWLSVNKTQGTINPMEKVTLIFTVDPSTNIGSYECDIRLRGSKNIDEILPVLLKVTGTRPDWSVNPNDYGLSMNVIGQIQIGGVGQEDSEDMLAAFIGNRCAGVVHPQFDKTKNAYIFYMDIYAKVEDLLLPVKFSLWDASTGRIYPGVDVYEDNKPFGIFNFVDGTIEGEVVNPLVFNATDKIEQQLNMKKGWNWISTNVENTTLIDQFKTGLEKVGEQIKTKVVVDNVVDGVFISNSDGNWSGTLDKINQITMYMLKTNADITLKLEGAMAKPADKAISISEGWNYIGYVPQFVAPVKDALSGLAAVNNDQIKGQVGFATYSGGAWYGSLQYMMPGLGYMYNSKNTNGSVFNYPSQYISQSKVAKQTEETTDMKWAVNINKYQMSMTVTGVVSVDNTEVANADMQMAVFMGDECRGTATLKYVDAYKRYMAFMMVWGNVDDVNKKITFRSYNPTNNQELSLEDQPLTYVADNIIGSVTNPYKISFVTSGTNETGMDMLKLYPNPVSDVLHFDCNPEGVEQVQILDNLGRQLNGYSNSFTNSMNVSSLVPGVYTLRIKYNGNVTNHMFIRK